MSENEYLFTSESVTEGHPDKVCDSVADAILDAYLKEDPQTRINIEALAKSNRLILSGEITSSADIDHAMVARDAISKIGYIDDSMTFNADTVEITQIITKQASEIDQGVSIESNKDNELGAGDQGMMFGFACKETPELMPLPIGLAHSIAKGLAEARKQNVVSWLKPDGKAQVTIKYLDGTPIGVDTVVVSTQHDASISQLQIREFIHDYLLPKTLSAWNSSETRVLVNPTGSFVAGGPEVDSGLTGRKIIVDTYGGAASHGGGSFSGKDCTKVDRSGAYFARYIARNLVAEGLCDKAEIQIAYAIGVAQPVSIRVNSFGTGDQADVKEYVRSHDFRPAAIIDKLQLTTPIFSKTTNYGHFGKTELPWERGRNG